MANSTRFVVKGRCSGLGSAQHLEDPTATDAGDFNELPASFAAEQGLWRFKLSRPARSTWRRNRLLLKTSRQAYLADCSWSPCPSGWPPADRAGAIWSEAARSSGAASHPRLSGPSHGLAFQSSPASAPGAAPTAPSAHAGVVTAPPGPSSTLPTNNTASDGSVSSALQRHALLQLLGPSTSPGHVTGRSLITDAAAGMAALLSWQQPQPPAALPHPDPGLDSNESTRQRGFAPAALRPDTWERAAPLAQLQAACLASVAAALVHLPRVWGEQVPYLPGMFLRALNPNFRVGPVGAHTATQPPLSLQQQGSPAKPPAACITAAPKTGGQKSGALPPAALALAAGAAGPASTAASSETVELLYAMEGTDSSSYGNSRVGTSISVLGGSVSSGTDGAAAGRLACLAGEGARRLGVQPPQKAEAPGQQVASVAGAEAEAAEGRVKEIERPKVFGDPIRYCKLLFAGAMSAVVSRTCVAPLERVKMDLLLKNGTGDAFTTAAQVLRTEGIAGFWKGNALNVLRTAPFKAVNFFSFDMYRTAFIALSGREENLERFLAGACAGVTATLICFPLDVVRTRLMASVAGPRYGSGPFSTLAGILRNEGAPALYSGCLPAVIGMAPAGAVFYGVYDMLKHQHLEKQAAAKSAAQGEGQQAAGPARAAEAAQPQTLDPAYTLLYGAMAGAASELIVYPLEVIRRKMQLQSMALANMRQVGGGMGHHHHPHHLFGPHAGPASAAAAAGGRLATAAHHHHHHMLPYHLGAQKLIATLSAAAVANSPGLARVAAAVTAILSTDGPRGFYSGLLPNMLQVLPSAALSYYTYDTLKTAMGAR